MENPQHFSRIIAGARHHKERARGQNNVQIELDQDDSKKYKVKAICNNAFYASELEGHLPGLYYLVSWKGYPKEENTWEPALAVLHFHKLISTFY